MKIAILDHWLNHFQFAIINTSPLIFRPNLFITFGDNVEMKLMDFYPKLDLMYLTQIRVPSCKCYSKYNYIELFLFYLCLGITFYIDRFYTICVKYFFQIDKLCIYKSAVTKYIIINIFHIIHFIIPYYHYILSFLTIFLDDNRIELHLERYAIGNEIVRIFIRMHKSIHWV